MTTHLSDHRAGFPLGFTPITHTNDAEDNTGIALGILRLSAGERYATTVSRESAYLLMSGHLKISMDDEVIDFYRESLFDDGPSCLHISAGTRLRFECATDVEFTLYAVENTRDFLASIYYPDLINSERRGLGQVGNTCLRLVRTIFDRSNAPSAAELVLGEVITLPGRWSSYPPHHHNQPELYHYRFNKRQGYGHAELGSDVCKVAHYDTLKILDGKDHAQVAAPGYAMYYSWVIRHLPEAPYIASTFTEDHQWILEQGAPIWNLSEHDKDTIS